MRQKLSEHGPVQDIVICIGSFSSATLMAEFCTQTHEKLRAMGIAYPNTLKHIVMANGYDQGMLGVLAATPTERLALEHHLRTLRHDLETDPRPICGLSLLIPNFFIYQDRLHRLQSACRKIFPLAKQKVLFCLERQDLEIEARYHTHYGLYGEPTMEKFLKIALQQQPKYDDCLQNLSALFTPDAVHTVVPENGAARREQVLETLCTAHGLSGAQTAELETASFVTKFDARLPREVLHFIRIANMGRHGPANPGTLIRWSAHKHRFTQESGYTPSPHSLLGPKLRTEILEIYAESNAAAAKKLGLPHLFPAPTPEPDWEPWTGLTPDIAYQVAERLDQEFIQDLLIPFEQLPNQYLTRERYIVHRALLELADPGAVKTLPHRRFQSTAKVSVLTLTYNHADFIEDNIRSVIEQKTTFPVEHIIADDGSDDETQDIVLQYAQQYPHIIPVFQKERSHGPTNVRALFEMARSPYVAMCDGDDYFTNPTKLQTQADFLDANPECALCFHPVRVVYEDGSNRERVYPPVGNLPRGPRPFYYLSDLLRGNLMQTNSVMYRWRFKNGLPDWFRSDLLPGDWYWHLLHAEQGKIGFINKIMGVYRRHKKSVYYSAEINSAFHRNKTGLQELEMYSTINKHLNGKYRAALLPLINGVFLEAFNYSSETGDNTNYDAMVKAYPEFSIQFLRSFKGYFANKPKNTSH